MASRETTLDLGLIAVILVAVIVIFQGLKKYLGPGTAFANAATNAATGQLSDAQKQALASQEATGIVQAGGNADTAQQQANADITAVTESQPGFFGFLWQEVVDFSPWT